MSLARHLDELDPFGKILLALAAVAIIFLLRGGQVFPDRRIDRREAIDIARDLREDPSTQATVRATLDRSPPDALDAEGPVYVITFDERSEKVTYFIEQLGGDVLGGQSEGH